MDVGPGADGARTMESERTVTSGTETPAAQQLAVTLLLAKGIGVVKDVGVVCRIPRLGG